MLAGLKDRMMAPEIAAEAMHAYATETNRINRERRSSRDAWNAELEKIDRELDKVVDAILAGVPPQKLKGQNGEAGGAQGRAAWPP